MKFAKYEIRGKNDFSKKDVINLTKEIRANGNPGFSLAAFDVVNEIRFMAAEATHLRVILSKQQDHFFIDIQLFDYVPQMRKADRYEDKSVFMLKS